MVYTERAQQSKKESKRQRCAEPLTKATDRVLEERVGGRLRKEEHNVVVLGPLPVARVHVEDVTERVDGLLAAVPNNVERARSAYKQHRKERERTKSRENDCLKKALFSLPAWHAAGA